MTTIPAGPDVNPVAVARLVQRIRAERPDLVHTHLIHGDTHGQAAARLCSVVGVSSFHGCHPFYERPPYGAVSRLAWRSPRVTIAISEHLRRYLVERKLAPADRVRVIHYGMDVAGWRFTEDERERERARLELGPDDVAVVVSSRLVPEKGHADLIDAMAIALRGDDRLRLLVAGDGPLRESLEAQAATVLPPGSYRFLGFVADIRAFMNAADVFVFPTTPDFGEGFGLAALEASAVGLPIVATSVGPIPEVVADGVSGRLVPPSRPGRPGRGHPRAGGGRGPSPPPGGGRRPPGPGHVRPRPHGRAHHRRLPGGGGLTSLSRRRCGRRRRRGTGRTARRRCPGRTTTGRRRRARGRPAR